jgi:hypothetical protein
MHTLKTFYRPDDYPHWLPWQEFIQKFEMIGKAGDIDAGGIPTARPGFAPRVPFGKPPDAKDYTTGRNLRRGYNFQVKLVGTGHVIINRFRIHAQKQIEKSTANPMP